MSGLDSIIEQTDKLSLSDLKKLEVYVCAKIKQINANEPKVYLKYITNKRLLIEHVNYVLGFDILEEKRNKKNVFARRVFIDYLLKDIKEKFLINRGSTLAGKILNQNHATVIYAQTQYNNDMFLADKNIHSVLFFEMKEKIENAITEFYESVPTK